MKGTVNAIIVDFEQGDQNHIINARLISSNKVGNETVIKYERDGVNHEARYERVEQVWQDSEYVPEEEE